VITLPVLSLTLAIFLSPEFGFFGFVVPTFRHTPLSSGLSLNCGDRSFRAFCAIRPCRRTCINVHLFARDAGVRPTDKAGVLFWKAVAAMEGRIDRAGANEAAERTEGRARRRKNVRDMVRAVVWLEMWAMDKSSIAPVRRWLTQLTFPVELRLSQPEVPRTPILRFAPEMTSIIILCSLTTSQSCNLI
jgi:hypothetical protein